MPRSIPLAVTFTMTDDANTPLPGESLRLFLGLGDQHDPNAGQRMTTGADGKAAFATTALIDRCWYWRNIGFTGLSWPLRANHLALAAELDHVLLGDTGETHLAMLLTADIWQFKTGESLTLDFIRAYAAGTDGRFTVLLNRGRDVAIPDSPLRLSGLGYRISDFMLEPGDPWRLRLAFKKLPKPVRR
jgi:hypothetical protein